MLGVPVKRFTLVNPVSMLVESDDFMVKFYPLVRNLRSPVTSIVSDLIAGSDLVTHPLFNGFQPETVAFLLFHWLRSLYFVDICPTMKYSQENCPPTLCLRWKLSQGDNISAAGESVSGVLVSESIVQQNQNYSQTWNPSLRLKQVMIGVARFANHICWREQQMVPSVSSLVILFKIHFIKQLEYHILI